MSTCWSFRGSGTHVVCAPVCRFFLPFQHFFLFSFFHDDGKQWDHFFFIFLNDIYSLLEFLSSFPFNRDCFRRKIRDYWKTIRTTTKHTKNNCHCSYVNLPVFQNNFVSNFTSIKQAPVLSKRFCIFPLPIA